MALRPTPRLVPSFLQTVLLATTAACSSGDSSSPQQCRRSSGRFIGVLVAFIVLALTAAACGGSRDNVASVSPSVQLAGSDLSCASQKVFTSLDVALLDSANVCVLDLSSSGLTTLPVSISKLTQLKVLYLVDNELTDVPMGLADLTSLQVLDLTGNPIANDAPGVARLSATNSQVKIISLSSMELLP